MLGQCGSGLCERMATTRCAPQSTLHTTTRPQDLEKPGWRSGGGIFTSNSLSLTLLWGFLTRKCEAVAGSAGTTGIETSCQLPSYSPGKFGWVESFFEMVGHLSLTCASLPLADVPLLGVLGPREAIDFSQASRHRN